MMKYYENTVGILVQMVLLWHFFKSAGGWFKGISWPLFFFFFFLTFHRQCVFKNSLNASLLALVLKKNNVVNIKDFCPISLVHSVHKVLANR